MGIPLDEETSRILEGCAFKYSSQIGKPLTFQVIVHELNWEIQFLPVSGGDWYFRRLYESVPTPESLLKAAKAIQAQPN